MKDLVVLGAGVQRGIAENELKLSLSMGEENARNSIGKCRILVVLVAVAPRGLAESELRVDICESKREPTTVRVVGIN